MIRTHRFVLIGCAASALLAAGRPAPGDASSRQASAVMARLPLRFEANQGQFGPAVRYAAHTSSYDLLLTAHGAQLAFPQSHERVSLDLPGSAATPAIEPLEKQQVVTDYLVGDRSQWHTGVASYSRIRYRSVYPGVDLVFYGNGNQLEYDFLLQAGANPDAVQMRFQGAAGVSLTADGDLAIDGPGGRILQKKPLIYQQDPKTSAIHTVAGGYTVLAGGRVGLHLDGYDRSQPLTIDPVITYSTLLGGGGTETIAGMKIQNGLVYISGSTQTGDWVEVSIDIPYVSDVDAFVAIIDTTTPGGYSLKYFTYLGGSSNDTPLAMDVDQAGFVYLTGFTTSTNFPVSTGAIQTAGALATESVFLSKIDPHQAGTGYSLVYSTFLSGTLGNDQGEGVAAGPNGMAYIIGTTKSADFPLTPNAYASSLYGPSDCFMAQIDTINGVLLYSSFFGSEADDDGRDILLAPNGLVYYVGTTYGAQFPVAGPAYNINSSGNYDIVIGAFDLTKSGVNTQVYGTYFGGSQIDVAKGAALDSQGRLILTGYTLSSDFPVTALTAMQPTNHGNADAFVALVDLNQPGADFLVYSTYLGGSDGEVGYGVTSDSAGYLYLTGYTLSKDYPVANAVQPNWGGGTDLFVARINPAIAGSAGLDFSTYIGLDQTLIGYGMGIGSDGSLWVTGITENYLPLLPSYTPIQSNFGGGFDDDFLLVFSPGAGATGPAHNATALRVGKQLAPIEHKPTRTVRK